MNQASSHQPNLNGAFTPEHLDNRAYGIKELAVLYFPNITPASASKRLKQWIVDSPELLEKLGLTGYYVCQRIVSPLQKDLIVDAFGSPF